MDQTSGISSKLSMKKQWSLLWADSNSFLTFTSKVDSIDISTHCPPTKETHQEAINPDTGHAYAGKSQLMKITNEKDPTNGTGWNQPKPWYLSMFIRNKSVDSVDVP